MYCPKPHKNQNIILTYVNALQTWNAEQTYWIYTYIHKVLEKYDLTMELNDLTNFLVQYIDSGYFPPKLIWKGIVEKKINSVAYTKNNTVAA